MKVKEFGIWNLGFREKRGSVNLMIGKLIKFILLFIVLALVVYGITIGGFTPLLENIEMKFDDVLAMFDFSGDSDSGDCYSNKIVDLKGGDIFLDRLGIKNRGAVFGVCDNGVCNLTWDGGPSYRVKKGVFEMVIGGDWVPCGSVFKGDVDDIKFYWELYNGAVDILEYPDIKAILDKGITKQFRLVSVGTAEDRISSAFWQNGVWRVSVDGREVEVYEDDDKAIDRFVIGVRDGLVDDDVYWGFVEDRPEVEFLFDSDKGIDSLLFDDFERIYDSLSAAEHTSGYSIILGKFKKSYDPWIRTEVNIGIGSSAYGPVQLTKGLAESYRKKDMGWSEEERVYLDRFIEQGELFLKYGGKDIPLNGLDGDKNVNMYDYGGSGHLTKSEDKEMYKQVVRKMLLDMYVRHDGDTGKVWKEWRFGYTKIDSGRDWRYGNIFSLSMIRSSLKNIWKYGDSREMDRDADVVELKRVFAELKKKELSENRISEKDLADLGLYLGGEVVSVSGRNFEFGVEQENDEIIVTLSDDGDKFGLMQIGRPGSFSEDKFLVDGSLRNAKLRYFFSSLVEWDRTWKRAGDESYYRLPKKSFDEVFIASVVNNFIREKCK